MHHALRPIVAGALLVGSQASADLISPQLAVHETLTRMAYACAARATAQPSACWTKPGKLESIAASPYSLEEKAARWPDDPLRQGSSKSTMPGLGKSIIFDCPKQVKGADGRDKTIYAAGILCSSHYGRLQFLHAMASAGDTDRVATLGKIYAWSAFTFDVASGRVDFDADICSVMVPPLGEDSTYAALADTFEAAPRRSCVFPKGQSGMSVRAFFATDCSLSHRPDRPCPVVKGTAGDALARRAALGALLHLVQDSYSQSHAARPILGKAVFVGGPFTATVACTFPNAYFDYGAQARYKNHADGDQRPTLDPSCAAGPVDDPATASAVILWKVRNGEQASGLLAYLIGHVFGPG